MEVYVSRYYNCMYVQQIANVDCGRGGGGGQIKAESNHFLKVRYTIDIQHAP